MNCIYVTGWGWGGVCMGLPKNLFFGPNMQYLNTARNQDGIKNVPTSFRNFLVFVSFIVLRVFGIHELDSGYLKWATQNPVSGNFL